MLDQPCKRPSGKKFFQRYPAVFQWVCEVYKVVTKVMDGYLKALLQCSRYLAVERKTVYSM